MVTPERAALPAEPVAPVAPVAVPVVAKPQSKLAETLSLLETKVVPPETRQMLIAMASTIDDLRLISDLSNATDSEDFLARLAAGAALGPDGQPIPPPEGLIFDGSLNLDSYSDQEMPELFGHLKAAAATGMLRLNLPV